MIDWWKREEFSGVILRRIALCTDPLSSMLNPLSDRQVAYWNFFGPPLYLPSELLMTVDYGPPGVTQWMLT